MKIVWLTNYPLPQIARKVGLPETVNEGWLVTLANQLLEIEWKLIFCTTQNLSIHTMKYEENNLTFYGVYDEWPNRYNSALKEKFADILESEKPDIIHIMGSEFPHSFSMYEACKKIDMVNRCVVSIQGLISKIALVYDLGIDECHKKKRLLWDLIINDSILLNKKDFLYRGEYEKLLLSDVKNVIGRTEWDYMCAKQMNPDVKYFKCNETLRDVFYENAWNYEKCEKHSIIISQATYPVKGFHILLQGVAELRKKYKDIKIYVPSQTVYPVAMRRNKCLNSDYANYIIELIKKNHLENNVFFLGSLDAKGMCRAYLRSNVFVCPSTVENSSNSLGEAMLLGMPVVASYVGGLNSMMMHGREGYFFPFDEVYMMVNYISTIFEKPEKAVRLGVNARIRAQKTHDKERNLANLKECYERIGKMK